jgi:GTP cyclohydrolase II
VPVRVHSECLTSEVLGSLRCDCNAQLDSSLAYIAERRFGLLVYLRQEGRGTGLVSKIDAYALQDAGLDTVEASRALGVPVDARSYELAAEVIRHLGIVSVSLMTNNPAKIDGLREHGVEVASRIPLLEEQNEHNGAYMRAKRVKMHHLI